MIRKAAQHISKYFEISTLLIHTQLCTYIITRVCSYLYFPSKRHYCGALAGGRLRHAFIGIGFRERPEAYDFQAALHDHMKYASFHTYKICNLYICLLSFLNYATRTPSKTLGACAILSLII